MKKTKKFFAILLSLTMLLSLVCGSQVFADEEPTPPQKKYAVLGVEDGLTVMAYQIIKLNSEGTAFVPVLEPASIDTTNDKLSPTSYNIQALAGRLGELKTIEGPANYVTDRYIFEDLAPGSWLIMVSGTSEYLYNPAVISVKSEGRDLNMKLDNWYDGAYVKKSEPKIKKEVITPNSQSIQYCENNDDMTDEIQFKITVDIPDYTVTAINAGVTYKISDILTGMKYKYDAAKYPVTVSILDKNNTKTEDSTLTDLFTKAITGATDNRFTADLSVSALDPDSSPDPDAALRAFFIKNVTKQLVITYYAEPIVPDTNKQVDEFTNQATFTYTANAQENTKLSDTTYHYSFGLGNEFTKIDDESTVTYDTTGDVLVKLASDSSKDGKALADAVFNLVIVKSDNTEIPFLTGLKTDNKGHLNIHGLDSDVTYRLRETKAPDFYTANAATVDIKITPTYTNSILTKYSIELSYKDATQPQSYTTNYTYDSNSNTTTFVSGEALGFKNTTFGNLPSTGGIGTTIFTIGGCILMLIAVVIFFLNRKKGSE